MIKNPLPRWTTVAIGLATFPLALMANPAAAAERLIVTFGPFQRSISVNSLEIYATEGTIPPDLRSYTRYFSEADLAQLRDILVTDVNLNAVAVSQFLYTEQGEILLQRLGEVIRTEANLSGFYALRAALILAASEPGGLTPLNVLREFPLAGIRVDLSRVLSILGTLERLITQTQDAIAAINEQSAAEAAAFPPLDLTTLGDLRQLGPYNWRRTTITVRNPNRIQSFPVDLYLPLIAPDAPPDPAPVVVISHGLGSDRTAFAYLAEHLVSYGFAVAVPEHPGSNSEQLQALVSGRANQVTAPEEFANRPLDIKFLLDRLEQLNQTDPLYSRRLNLEQVGVMGQSFGGYTALVLAGAEINFPQLTASCTPANLSTTFNLSLLLQCRALELFPMTKILQDERVKAVMPINPIGSSILGREGFANIQIPVMLVTSTADTVAPSLPEQIQPFTWLNAPNQYLLLMEGGTHFSVIDVPDPNAELVPLPTQFIGPDPAIARNYLNAISVAFFKTTIANQPEYQAYLSPSYIEAISQDLLPISLVRSLDGLEVAQNPEGEVVIQPEPFPNRPGAQVQ